MKKIKVPVSIILSTMTYVAGGCSGIVLDEAIKRSFKANNMLEKAVKAVGRLTLGIMVNYAAVEMANIVEHKTEHLDCEVIIKKQYVEL